MMLSCLVSLGAVLVGVANGLASTDTITWGGDNTRSGYQTNHNLDPAIVGSSEFDEIFKTTLPGNYIGEKEEVFSQPLVYTPSSDGRQYAYFATTQNNLYKLDAKTGEIVASRNLHIPFLTADLDGCVDINPTIGIIGTAVIDPETDTIYLAAKTYADQNAGSGPQGKPNGRYFIHAIDALDLSERPNFPVDLEGLVARNNPVRSFNGGIHLQRPALLHVGDYIYAGFGSHCVQYNFTGWIIGWHKTSGEIVERFATQGDGVENDVKGAGVWMSGGGLASDDAGSMFFATGNGYASQLASIPVRGRDPPSALEEAVVHMTIRDDGSLGVVDFFMPWDKQSLDGADKDLGTSPLEILPGEFACGDVKRIGVVTGKSGKTYWLNLDNLGGYRNGPDNLDAVIQTYQNENSVYAGAGVYPLEGGYIYINVVRYPSIVFKFTCDNNVPFFTKVAESPMSNSYTLGVSHGTVTSLGGQAGTGLLWVTDVQDVNIRIFDAVPRDGELNLIKSFRVPGITKFSRPVFGDGIMYVGTNQGLVYGFGSPVASPVNCTVTQFSSVEAGESSRPYMVVCASLIDMDVEVIQLEDGTGFTLSALPPLPKTVTAGSFFTFNVTFKPTGVGLVSDAIVIRTTNSVGDYRTESRVRISGASESRGPLLDISPRILAFEEVVVGENPQGINSTLLLINKGNAPLAMQQILYSTTSPAGHFTSWEDSDAARNGPFVIGPFPASILPNSQAPVVVNFNPTETNNLTLFIQFISDGGEKGLTLTGSAGNAASARLEFEDPDGGGWIRYQNGVPFDFGNVTENTLKSLKLRLTNDAAEGSVRLVVTVSKPPFGLQGIISTANQVDLAEGVALEPGQSETATIYCSVPKRPWNTEPYDDTAVWTLNFNDVKFGKQTVQFVCKAVSEQAPPLLENGLGRYRYAGCFKENSPGRQLATQIYGDGNNTNAMCIAACAAAEMAFCGTQYLRECWAGPSMPTLQVDEANCNYACAGDINQYCGGNGMGEGEGGAYISLFADTTSEGPSVPIVNPGTSGYSSLGCYTEPSQGRTLPFGNDMMEKTVSSCVIACASGSYEYAGLEYGRECWCGNEIADGAIRAPDEECSMTCADNSTEYCGGPSRLNLYKLGDAEPAPPSSTSSPTATSPAPSTSAPMPTSSLPSSGPTIKEHIGPFTFQGCFTEATDQRALPDAFLPDDNMTLKLCAEFCSRFVYFGVEYGRECWCGNLIHEGSVMSANQEDCSFPCPGDGDDFCGAGDRLQLYQQEAEEDFVPAEESTVTSPATPSVVASPAVEFTLTSALAGATPTPTLLLPTVSSGNENFTYHGCWQELSTGRLLEKQVVNDGNLMSIQMCLSSCWMYEYAGVEYGRECWCGNDLRLYGNATTAVSDGECDFLCPGNPIEFCGGSLMLSLYAAKFDVED